MQYETFLFTRNLRRDFTAFIRPAAMTNKEVSVIASAFNYVNDITPFTPEQPALYCFPLGASLYLLRHYNSGRTHAGREIPVIEGIAIRRDDEPQFRPLLPAAIHNHAALLNTLDAEIEEIEIHTPEARAWTDDFTITETPFQPDTPEIVADYAKHYAEYQLVLPFGAQGFGWLSQVVAHPNMPLAHFAFGTNPDVVGRLREAGIDFDILGYLNVSEADLKQRPAPKVVDVREILPKAATVPSNWPATPLPVDPPDIATEPDFLDEAEVEIAPSHSTNAINTERERRREMYRPRRRPLLRVLVDWLLGKD